MKKCIVSFSGGKDSMLALDRIIRQGYEPILLVTTYNPNHNRSYVHRINKDTLQDIAKHLNIPIFLVNTSIGDYASKFEQALIKGKNMGAKYCVFGDIDIEDHRSWGKSRCLNVGIEALYPLWQEERKQLVKEFIKRGYIANIIIINTTKMPEKYLGKRLTTALLKELEQDNIDVCGENGEYHTIVIDGPPFEQPLKLNFDEKHYDEQYAVLSVSNT